VLIACEFSGIVRDAFREAGHDAVSCDLLPTERPGPHIQGDVREVLGDGWDLMVAHPPCTYLSRAGARWWKVPGRQEKAEEAAAFIRLLYDAPIPRVAIENPIGMLNRLWRYPDQTIEPFEFGDPFRKRTCLWLRGLPPLLATVHVADPKYWIDSYPGRRTPGFDYRSTRGSARRASDRARTFPGIAAAMANQWGSLLAARDAA
jgi:hypothetical protein